MAENTSDSRAHKKREIIERDSDLHMQAEQLEKLSSGVASSKQASTVLIIEKRPLIRDLLSSCIARTIDLRVAVAISIEEYMEYAQDGDVVVVLVGIGGDPEGQENQNFIRHIVETMADAPTIVISDSEDLHQIMTVLRIGAQGYISTSMSFDLAMSAIRLVQAGGQFVPASSLLDLGRSHELSLVAGRRSPLLEIFTTRQAAVVDALRQGKANKIIAYELGMRESTVKVHVRNVMKKLKARNRTEVAYITSKLVAGIPLPHAESNTQEPVG